MASKNWTASEIISTLQREFTYIDQKCAEGGYESGKSVVCSKLLDRLHEFSVDIAEFEIRERVQRFFKNQDKTDLWMKTPNPMFGNISPNFMIRVGRAHRVIKFIEDAERERP